MKLAKVILAATLNICLLTQAVAQDGELAVLKQQSLVTYRPTERMTMDLQLQCLQITNEQCTQFRINQETRYKIGDNAKVENRPLTAAMSRQELDKRLNLTVVEDMFKYEDPAQTAVGIMALPAVVLLLGVFIPTFYVLIPAAVVIGGAALVALPVALVGSAVMAASAASKRARWKKLVADVQAEREIKRPLRVRKGELFQAFITVFADKETTTELESSDI